MKKSMLVVLVAVVLGGCGGAVDGSSPEGTTAARADAGVCLCSVRHASGVPEYSYAFRLEREPDRLCDGTAPSCAFLDPRCAGAELDTSDPGLGAYAGFLCPL